MNTGRSLQYVRSSSAERAGFEPAVGFYPHAALAKCCQALSEAVKTSKSNDPVKRLVLLLALAANEPGRLHIFHAWPTIPANIRSAILALIGSQR